MPLLRLHAYTTPDARQTNKLAIHSEVCLTGHLHNPAMSAPSIPNLLSLRGSRGGARSRLQRRGGGPPPPAIASLPAPSSDAVVQGTDTDAALSRMSAVDLGYLDDPYAPLFVQLPALGSGRRRLPIINRGEDDDASIPLLHCQQLKSPVLKPQGRYICAHNRHRQACRSVPGRSRWP